MARISRSMLALVAAMLLYFNSGSLIRAQSDPSISTEDARTLAQEAWVFGLPLVFVDSLLKARANLPPESNRRIPVNQFVHYRDFSDLTELSMNVATVDTLYSVASVDLTEEPLVLTVPDMGARYWNLWLVDAWNNVPHSLGTRISGGKGGDYVLVGPNWKEQVPAGLTQLKMPTSLAMLFARIATADRGDGVAVHALQDGFKLVPLSKWGTTDTPSADHPPSTNETSRISVVQPEILAMSPEAFFGRLNALLVANPPEPADPAIMERLARLGIRPGAKFDFAALRPEVQTAVQQGMEAGQTKIQDAKLGAPLVNHWNYALDFGRFGTDYAYRAYRTFLGVGGTLAEDAIDPLASEDADGMPFDGANRYVLKFSKDELPPAKYMWSVTMFDDKGAFVANALDRYAVQSRGGIKFGSDGSLSILIQSHPPKPDEAPNWLPAPTSGRFFS